MQVDGHNCSYSKQWSEDKVNDAVEEVIRKLVQNPKFEEAILNKIGARLDTSEVEKEIEELSWDNESTVETVCLLFKLNTRLQIEIDLDMDRLTLFSREDDSDVSNKV